MLVIFDMGNVVSRSVDILPPLAEKTGIPESQLRELCRDDFFGLTTGEASVDEFWTIFSQRFGIKVSENYLATLFKPEMDMEMVELLRELKAEGHRVVCGTNTIESHYRIHEARGDYSIFDKVYASHLMGDAKPARAFYDFIVKAEYPEDTERKNVLFVDDLPENVEGARRAGLSAHLFTGREGVLAFLTEYGIASALTA